MKYTEALAWLYSLQRFGIKLGLENIRRLIAETHVDLGGARVIHVAGTNGKGSVCAMIDSICRAQKVRSGSNGGANIDIVILETGLGGRLDATNAIQSDVAVITPIALDHEEWLGDSLEKIANEKAGIIKAQTPVVSASQLPDADKVIRARATECEAPLQFVEQVYDKSPIALRGEHQKLNAAIAIAAIRAANVEIDEAAVTRGLATVEWPGRFQCWDRRTVIDGAHNPAAARILTQTWREIFGDERATLILAILSDKDLHGICEALAPIANSVLLPKIRSERAADPEKLAKIFERIASVCRAGASPAGNRSGCPTISIASSFAEALELARAQPNPVLITGSLHFAGEALAHLQGKPAAFEECAQ